MEQRSGRRSVIETFDYDGGRQVTFDLPPGAPQAVVVAADGAQISRWGVDLATADAPPTMIAGVHATADPDELARLREYSPPFDPERFAAHERFVLQDVRARLRSRFGVDPPPRRTAVYGASAGAEFALAMGMRHPDVFGAVLAASPGAGYRPPAPMPAVLPRVYLVAGRQEPFFLDNALRWAEALRAAGGEVVMTERAGDHGDPFWRAELPLMVEWAFRG